MGRPTIFLSYSHRDERALRGMLPYLAALERESLVTVWVDREDIREGNRWMEEIEAALGAASIAVLLVSQHFLASEFIYREELPRILARQARGRLVVLPVFLSPSTVTSDAIVFRNDDGQELTIRLSDFQGFGTPTRTLTDLRRTERERTFVRLHDCIRALASNQSDPVTAQLVGTPALNLTERPSVSTERPRIAHIPYARNRNFIGREDYLEQLLNDLKSGTPAAVTQAIAGLGGIGKTQLALEYSYRYGSGYDVVWWVRSEKSETQMSDLAALGRSLTITGPDTELARAAAATVDWLDHHGDWLVVFDNVEHPNDIAEVLPKTGRGHIIITSRYAAWGAVAHTLRIGVWPSRDAVDYLSKRTGQRDDAAASDIADALGYLPLALTHVAAYIDETGCGFEGYLELLKSHPAETLRLRSNSSDAEKAVATVWEIAFNCVADANPRAIALLNLFAFLGVCRTFAGRPKIRQL